MKLILKINKAIKIVKSISKNEFYYLNEDKYLVKYTNSDNIIILKDIVCETIEEWNSGFLINEKLFYNYLSYIPLFNEDFIYKSLIIDELNLFVKKIDFENEEIIFGIYNSTSQNIKWKKIKDIIPFYTCVNKTFISFQKYGYQNYTLNMEILWQTSFKDLVQSETVHTYPELIEHNQKLYFQLQSENRKGVFCIDVNTGKEITLYIDCYGFLIQDEDFVYTSKYENILCKINPKTNECEEWDVDELIKSNGFDSISDHRCVVEDGKVYE